MAILTDTADATAALATIAYDELKSELQATRENAALALDLLENPVFDNDHARALDILRAIAAEL
jgi:hypothetical protein